MKGYERRAAGIESYFNLDVWNEAVGCWVKTKRQYADESEARRAAKRPGRYRISRSGGGGERVELEPFTVTAGVVP